jgi:hypothetical protein
MTVLNKGNGGFRSKLRWPANRKMDMVLCLLRDEELSHLAFQKDKLTRLENEDCPPLRGLLGFHYWKRLAVTAVIRTIPQSRSPFPLP